MGVARDRRGKRRRERRWYGMSEFREIRYVMGMEAGVACLLRGRGGCGLRNDRHQHLAQYRTLTVDTGLPILSNNRSYRFDESNRCDAIRLGPDAVYNHSTRSLDLDWVALTETAMMFSRTIIQQLPYRLWIYGGAWRLWGRDGLRARGYVTRRTNLFPFSTRLLRDVR